MNPFSPRKISLLCGAAIAYCLLAGAASAQTLYQVSSGTGFFVSKSGYIVTNEHVVKGCRDVQVRGAVKPSRGTVVASDADIDLALIKTDVTPPRFAPFRSYGRKIQKGDGLLVMGYPGNHGLTGEYKIVESTVMDTDGPMGEEKWLQFTDSAQQGNSGGPLLDLSGNVVGVIVGKATLMKTNLSNGKEEVVQESDIAISLPYLTKFLETNRVNYWKMYSDLRHSQGYIEQNARQYIVNIHCRQ